MAQTGHRVDAENQKSAQGLRHLHKFAEAEESAGIPRGGEEKR